jgi:hypothetical protein
VPGVSRSGGQISLNTVEDHSFSRISISSLERDSPNLVEPLQAGALATVATALDSVDADRNKGAKLRG